MILCCCPWKVVTFFGKEHVNWSSINGVMIGRSLNIKFGKLKIGVNKKILDFSSLIFQLHPIISTVILDQMACFLPKTNTKFHQLFKYVKEDAIFSSIRWEKGRNIFGWRSLLSTVHSSEDLTRWYCQALIYSNLKKFQLRILQGNWCALCYADMYLRLTRWLVFDNEANKYSMFYKNAMNLLGKCPSLRILWSNLESEDKNFLAQKQVNHFLEF